MMLDRAGLEEKLNQLEKTFNQLQQQIYYVQGQKALVEEMLSKSDDTDKEPKKEGGKNNTK